MDVTTQSIAGFVTRSAKLHDETIKNSAGSDCRRQKSPCAIALEWRLPAAKKRTQKSAPKSRARKTPRRKPASLDRDSSLRRCRRLSPTARRRTRSTLTTALRSWANPRRRSFRRFLLWENRSAPAAGNSSKPTSRVTRSPRNLVHSLRDSAHDGWHAPSSLGSFGAAAALRETARPQRSASRDGARHHGIDGQRRGRQFRHDDQAAACRTRREKWRAGRQAGANPVSPPTAKRSKPAWAFIKCSIAARRFTRRRSKSWAGPTR